MRTNMIRKSTVRCLFAWAAILLLLIPCSSWAKAGREAGRFVPPALLTEPLVQESLISRKREPSYQSDEGFYKSLSPEDKARIENRSQKWETLPPEKRRELERRMDQWKALPPEEKDLMRKRHQQWQQLPPGEQDRIREKLNRWDSLTPQEQDDIRKKFKGP